MGTQADPRFWTFDAAIMDVAIDPLGGGIAVGLADGRIGIIDPIDGSLTLYSVHAGAVQQVVHDAVGARFVSAGDDGAIMRTMGDEASICVAQLGTRWIEALTTDPSTGVLYAAMGSELFAINHKGAQKFARLVSTPGALTWDSATDSLLVSHYGGVGRWHRDDLDQPARSFEWKGAHLAASASPDGRWVVSATQDGSLHVWPTDGSEDLGMRGYLAKPVSMAWTRIQPSC